MIKRFCDVCGAEIKKFNYSKARITDKDDIPYSNSLWEICHDCEQAIRACIGNRRAKAERG